MQLPHSVLLPSWRRFWPQHDTMLSEVPLDTRLELLLLLMSEPLLNSAGHCEMSRQRSGWQISERIWPLSLRNTKYPFRIISMNHEI
jgi:hypothetical protein